MVHAIVVQALHPSECEVLYYRFYSSSETSVAERRGGGLLRPPKLFDTPAEKKELTRHVARRVQVQFHMKLAQCLVPPPTGSQAVVRGGYTERGWKEVAELPVVWQGWASSGLGLALLCSTRDNLMQVREIVEFR
ncbi:hypothetical protein PR048_000899 [Dryococelus australis]|uniref:Uncharacterized protein n=1 Tax=Dryococelus australis TaxID=614101 RepID=A0ABQ9IFV6_9NEOP|nr:hypothetical protein PR048_000899 [Dryococelus australis]